MFILHSWNRTIVASFYRSSFTCPQNYNKLGYMHSSVILSLAQSLLCRDNITSSISDRLRSCLYCDRSTNIVAISLQIDSSPQVAQVTIDASTRIWRFQKATLYQRRLIFLLWWCDGGVLIAAPKHLGVHLDSMQLKSQLKCDRRP